MRLFERLVPAMEVITLKVSVSVGRAIRTGRDPDDGTLDNDVRFWHSWGPLEGGDDEPTVRVDFDPPVPIGANYTVGGEKGQAAIRTLVCIDGDAVGYGWAVKVVDRGLQAWFDETQVTFLCPSADVARVWELASDDIGVALRKFRSRDLRN